MAWGGGGRVKLLDSLPAIARPNPWAVSYYEDEHLPILFYPDDLPDLRRDPFNWTPEELAGAILTAREWLFPDPDPFFLT